MIMTMKTLVLREGLEDGGLGGIGENLLSR